MDQLRAIGGHPVQSAGHSVGAVAAIHIQEDGSLDAVADTRKDGLSKVSDGSAYP